MRLLKVIETLRNWVAFYIRNMVQDESSRARANQDHLRIVNALERRDSAGLRAAIQQHLRRSCDAVVASLGRVDFRARAAQLDGLKRARGKL